MLYEVITLGVASAHGDSLPYQRPLPVTPKFSAYAAYQRDETDSGDDASDRPPPSSAANPPIFSP